MATANISVRLSLLAKEKMLADFLLEIKELRKKVITARGTKSKADIDQLRYILIPEVGTRFDSYGSNQEIKKGNVVKAKLDWKGLYP